MESNDILGRRHAKSARKANINYRKGIQTTAAKENIIEDIDLDEDEEGHVSPFDIKTPGKGKLTANALS